MLVKFKIPPGFYSAAGPEPTATTDDSKKRLPAILHEPVAIKIYELDESTYISALSEARDILSDLRSFPHLGQEIPFVPDRFILEPGNLSGKQWCQDSVTLRYDPDLYKSVEDRPDETVLGSLRTHLYNMGYDAFWSPTSTDDKSTALAFRLVTMDDRAAPFKFATPMEIKNMICDVLDKQDIRVPTRRMWNIKIQPNHVHGFLDCMSRTEAGRLAQLEVLHFSSYTANCRGTKANLEIAFTPSQKTIPVTSCTTLALWIGKAWTSDAELEADARSLLQRAAVNLNISKKPVGDNFRRTNDGRIFCFDPDSTLLAMEVCNLPACNGFFYESAYLINSSTVFYRAEVAIANRDAKQMAYKKKYGKSSAT